MTVPAQLVNPARVSGYDHVIFDQGGIGDRCKNPYRAEAGYRGGHARGTARGWRGPRRGTALEAAQDYCDYLTGNGLPMVVARPTAGHSGKKRRRAVHPKRAEAYRLLTEARADESSADDNSGWVYCIGEKGAPPAIARVKLGKSKDDPIYRLAGLQTGNPRVLYVVASKKVADRHAAEKKLHDKFAEHCCTNEWFWTADCLDEILAEFNASVKHS